MTKGYVPVKRFERGVSRGTEFERGLNPPLEARTWVEEDTGC